MYEEYTFIMYEKVCNSCKQPVYLEPQTIAKLMVALNAFTINHSQRWWILNLYI